MAAVSGLLHSRNNPVYTGELFLVSPTITKFASMAGALTSPEQWDATDIGWQEIDLAAASQTAVVEGADPVYTARTAAKHGNVMQIFQYGFKVAYSVLGADGQIAAPGTAVDDQVAGQPRPLSGSKQIMAQTNLKLKQFAIDLDYSMLNGVYARPTDNATARKMRGMQAVVDLQGGTPDNIVAAGGAFTKAQLQTLIGEMATNGAVFEDMVLFFGSVAHLQTASSVYGLAPRDRTIGGVALNQILEDEVGDIAIAYDRHLTATVALLVDMAHITPKVMPIPGKGGVFVEPLAQTGAAVNYHLYGECSYSYGLPEFHGKITGLA